MDEQKPEEGGGGGGWMDGWMERRVTHTSTNVTEPERYRLCAAQPEIRAHLGPGCCRC